jgi:hypothetical protein
MGSARAMEVLFRHWELLCHPDVPGGEVVTTALRPVRSVTSRYEALVQNRLAGS